MSMTVRVTGLNELRSALKHATGGQRLDRELGKANYQWISKTLVPTMRSRAPVGPSGQLSSSPRGSRSAKAAAVLVGTETRVPYAGPINWGWPARNITGQEFIYSSIVATDTDLETSYIDHLDRFLSKAFPEGRL